MKIKDKRDTQSSVRVQSPALPHCILRTLLVSILGKGEHKYCSAILHQYKLSISSYTSTFLPPDGSLSPASQYTHKTTLNYTLFTGDNLFLKVKIQSFLRIPNIHSFTHFSYQFLGHKRCEWDSS